MKIKLFLLTVISATYASAQTGADLDTFFNDRWNDQATLTLDTCTSTSGESLLLKVDESAHVPMILGTLSKLQSSRRITMITMDGVEFMVEEIVAGSKETKKGSFNASTGKLTVEGNADIVLSCNKLGKK